MSDPHIIHIANIVVQYLKHALGCLDFDGLPNADCDSIGYDMATEPKHLQTYRHQQRHKSNLSSPTAEEFTHLRHFPESEHDPIYRCNVSLIAL